jgi:signal transduction protein with GAF and PtsI domain
VTIRTLDTGGDKKLPFFTITETNPFLGRRGIRFPIDLTKIFLTRLRALLRANAGLGNLHPAVVHVVGGNVQRAHRQNKPVGASFDTRLT